ncbi:hypothetical protein [Collimonas silvisoli]|nr:hypothetical protein [Collimonas silvisoli]
MIYVPAFFLKIIADGLQKKSAAGIKQAAKPCVKRFPGDTGRFNLILQT